MEKNLEVKPINFLYKHTRRFHVIDIISSAIGGILLVVLIAKNSSTIHYAIYLQFAVILGVCFIWWDTYKSYKNDYLNILTDGEVVIKDGSKASNFNVKDISMVEFTEFRGMELIFRNSKVHKLGSLQIRYYSIPVVQKILKIFKELKSDIEFDEESKKILDGKFK